LIAAAGRPRVDKRPPRNTISASLLPGTTPVLFTPRDVQLGLADRSRGSLVVLSAASPSADNWFRFDADIDFATTMPADQQPVTQNAGRSD
jgi:hypothetical protein